ncbi:MAG: DUF2779 domain-containing protein, partial [Bacteroidetes bacterium]|nr:DUF2779 domain-containing protein [Bacteroidota bacterium]
MYPRYLTKSRFKLACECPTKLWYTGKRDYANQSLTDTFLAELAKGGYQVGELAKCYHPGGVDITTLDHEEALSETSALLRCENTIIYEAAVAFSNLFIRVDVLVKQGTVLNLIEVKAKSVDSDPGETFLNRDGSIRAKWRSYLYDVAFQKYVLTHAFPDHTVNAFLLLVDKTALCPTDGLNQKFRVARDAGGRLNVRVPADLSAEDLTPPILRKVNVDEYVGMIWAGRDSRDPPDLSFNERIILYADHYERDEKLPPRIGSVCQSCEFYCTPEDEANGLQSGLEECWSEVLGWTEEDFRQPTVLDLWNYRKKDALIEQGRFHMRDVQQSDINPQPDGKPGISTSERQWLQVRKVRDNDKTVWLDRAHLRREIDSWTYPLHFIDFETTMVAIPFNSGRRPYEEIAFQFSHHLLHEDGRVEHAGEYINVEPGVFPNYDFVRALKRELEGDDGVIFRYAAHENTYLCKIDTQLRSDPVDIPDRAQLCAFIRSITRATGGSTEPWHGER